MEIVLKGVTSGKRIVTDNLKIKWHVKMNKGTNAITSLEASQSE